MIAKELPERLLVVADAMLLHQLYEILGRVPGQRRPRKMGVGGDEVLCRAVKVGEIAASSSGDQDLFPDALRPLEHGDAPAALTGFHRAHQSRCTRSKNENVKALSHPAFPSLNDKRSALVVWRVQSAMTCSPLTLISRTTDDGQSR